MTESIAPPTGSTPPPARARRRKILLGLGPALLVVVGAGAALAAFRYLPALDDARALRVELEAMVDTVREAGLDIDRATIDALEADLAASRERLDGLADLLGGDPLLALARALPVAGPNVRGADAVVEAADDLLDAAGDGLAIGRRFVAIREARAAGSSGSSTLAQLVELMATTRDRAVAASAAVNRARETLAAVPEGLVGQVDGVRDAMLTRLDEYGPLLDAYATASQRLPAILGWEGPRRYLVLAQDPAEIRPSGGLIGTYGIIAFDKGRVTEQVFAGVAALDIPANHPFVTPPQALADYLLGTKWPWELADAGWSPDFPTAAQDALRLYTNESGDARIDGVLAITTYTIDELLEVTGPVAIPEHDVTIATGETTRKILELTRTADPGVDRKAFLPVFADHLLAALLALPPRSWGRLIGHADALRDGRLLLAWFRDPADQQVVAGAGFDGAVIEGPGDYLFPVDSNVAPAGKLNVVTTRELDLRVELDAMGNARNTLTITWHNRLQEPDAAWYRATQERAKDNTGGDILGMYFRLLVPERSRVEAVAGGGLAPVTSPAVVEEEAGRTAIGTYLKIPPGRTSLTCTWISPYAAELDETGGVYRLTIQRQPGVPPGPLVISVHVPDGQRIIAASPELAVDGATATLATTFEREVVVAVRYAR